MHYLLLDIFGYKSDKLPKKTDNLQNILKDSSHSFYGAYCDYLVTSDKKLNAKSKALYNEFNISTKVIEPENLINELKNTIYNENKKYDLIHDILLLCKNNEPIESAKEKQIFAFKSSKFYFNFFNYVIYEYNSNENTIILTLRKVFKNISKYIFISEKESVLKLILQYFGTPHQSNIENYDLKFVYNYRFYWKFSTFYILVIEDEDTKRPTLIIHLPCT